MSIYTKTGDRGKTSLYGGKRVSKFSRQVEAYGSVDELTSFIGLVIARLKNKKEKFYLTNIQKELYQIMASLSGAPTDLKYLESSVLDFEKRIDSIERNLPKLTRFILPQGTELSSWFHVLRVTCRKVERNLIGFFNSQLAKPVINNKKLIIVKYLNRLSDLFFTFARWFGRDKEITT